jgi:FMN-dependent NADH-azoreductase
VTGGLPAPARRYLPRAIAEGTPLTRSVELSIRGTLRLAADRAPLAMDAILLPSSLVPGREAVLCWSPLLCWMPLQRRAKDVAMTRIFYVEASPRKQRSASIEVARHFLDAYRKVHPDTQLDELDLWGEPLPEFDGDMLDAKYAVLSGADPTPAQRAAWQRIEAMAARMKEADRLLFSTPMWNFSIPYKLKHWIDIVTQPGITFGHSREKGYFGLVTGKKALVVYAQGGDYRAKSPDAAFDLQTRYLRQALAFMGIEDQTEVIVNRGLAGPEADRKAREAARAEAERLATTF